MTTVPPMQDFLYDHAPLVEVIAEVHWELKTLESNPQARIDPYFDIFRDQFLDALKSHGFAHEERLFPKEIPIELLPYKPHLLLREQQNQWPLFQIGPGLFTANIIPPYSGWNEFRETLIIGLEALVSSYPLAPKTMNIGRTELRYIDAFTKELGMDIYDTFLEKDLGISSCLPKKIVENFLPKDRYPESKIENRFPSSKPEGSEGILRVSPGMAGDNPAAIMELICRKVGPRGHQTSTALADWFDSAHFSVRDWFNMITSEELQKRMGPRRAIGDGQ